MRYSAVILIVLVTLPSGSAFAAQHGLLTGILSRYVRDNGVDYADLCKDEALDQYLDQLKATDPKTLPRDAQFVLWLNAYNAYSLKAICSRYPIKSINDLNPGGLMISVLMNNTVWDRPTVIVGSKTYTLRQVDHQILRPMFKDPRIQFAISCGAIGCAGSPQAAYEEDTVDRQLDDQTRRFINDPRNNTFDPQARVAALSPLFNWSRKDFGKTPEAILLFTAHYLPEGISEDIKKDPSAWKIKYKGYDLTLNDVPSQMPPPTQEVPMNVYSFSMPANDGRSVSLGEYRGKVLLIVNTASRCGFTPQYKGLEALYQRYKDKGLEILAFPSNDFMGQEPGSNEEIRKFCELNYKTTFPIFAKSSVKGKDKNPLYKYLTEESAFKAAISWNFNKFVVNRKGEVAARFDSAVGPEDPRLVHAVEQALEDE